MNPGRYCRDVESYLCKKNDGHLIRIVGPSFGLVCGWAEQQIPIRVVCRAIDRTFERYYSKGTRRRPVRIEFCEADVLALDNMVSISTDIITIDLNIMAFQFFCIMFPFI